MREVNVAEEKLQTIRLRYDFYRDGFRKVYFSFLLIIVAIICLIVTFIYLYLTKPKPVVFQTYDNFRVVATTTPLNQPYVSDADVRQFISNVLQTVFVFDFYHYSDQLKSYQQYFTSNGWRIYLDFLNNYAVQDVIVDAKAFVQSTAENAPQIIEKGVLADGRYGWWVQMGLKINYLSSSKNMPGQNPMIRALIVRVPTTNNLSGIAVENIMLGVRNAPSTNVQNPRRPS
ncbi:MAG TPA: DotI/IcmL/TraM family protein [Gammaproteobacteria bacterium]|jgi:intracellular multiplication protein IcmL|nr:DotI/IcmL/TraM family protein [Gammaproteobacteria bacterium]